MELEDTGVIEVDGGDLGAHLVDDVLPEILVFHILGRLFQIGLAVLVILHGPVRG